MRKVSRLVFSLASRHEEPRLRLTLVLRPRPISKRNKSNAKGLYANMNARKKKGISRSKSESTVSDKAYANMKAGFPKKKKTLLKRKT